MSDLNQRVAELENQLNDSAAASAQANDVIEQHKTALRVAQADLAKAQRQCSETQEKLDLELKYAKEQQQHMRQTIDDLSADVQREKEAKTQLQHELSQMQQRFRLAQDESKESGLRKQVAELKKAAEEAGARAAEAAGEAKRAEGRAAEAEQALASAQSRLDVLKASVQSGSDEATSLGAQVRDLTATRDRLESDAAQLREQLDMLHASLDDTKREGAAAQARADALAAEKDKLSATVSTLQAKHEQLQADLDAEKECKAAADESLEAAKQQLHARVAELEKLVQEKNSALESAQALAEKTLTSKPEVREVECQVAVPAVAAAGAQTELHGAEVQGLEDKLQQALVENSALHAKLKENPRRSKPSSRSERERLSSTSSTSSSGPTLKRRLSTQFVRASADPVHKRLTEVLMEHKLTDDDVKYLGRGKYRFRYGSDSKVVNIVKRGDNFVVRVGGGWVSLDEFIREYVEKHRFHYQNVRDVDETAAVKFSRQHHEKLRK